MLWTDCFQMRPAAFAGHSNADVPPPILIGFVRIKLPYTGPVALRNAAAGMRGVLLTSCGFQICCFFPPILIGCV